MRLFNFLKKSNSEYEPYSDSSLNLIYNLLFCDDLELFKANTQQPFNYPFDVLFSEKSSIDSLNKIITDNSDPRIKILAYNRLIMEGQTPVKKDLLAVIVEVGLDKGLDVLASFEDGTARYINQTGKMLVWETKTDETANNLTKDLFSKSEHIINKIGPWDKRRKPYPGFGNARITLLVSDGLYFGEAPTTIFFNEPLASPALSAATELMKYLTEKISKTNKE